MPTATRTAAITCFKLHRKPTPAAPTGLFSVATIKKGEPQVDLYRFNEFSSDLPGRAFAIKKTEADVEQSDPYHVLLTDRGEHSCSCPSGTWRGGERVCRHILGMLHCVREEAK